jgi:hypothetical protein
MKEKRRGGETGRRGGNDKSLTNLSYPFYSGKKKRHTIKSQVVVDKKTKKVICTSFSNGKKHDFAGQKIVVG